jgi:hypothetical protein
MRNAPSVVIFQSLTKQFGKPEVIPVRLAQRPKYVNVVKTSHTKKPSLSRSPPSPIGFGAAAFACSISWRAEP